MDGGAARAGRAAVCRCAIAVTNGNRPGDYKSTANRAAATAWRSRASHGASSHIIHLPHGLMKLYRGGTMRMASQFVAHTKQQSCFSRLLTEIQRSCDQIRSASLYVKFLEATGEDGASFTGCLYFSRGWKTSLLLSSGCSSVSSLCKIIQKKWHHFKLNCWRGVRNIMLLKCWLGRRRFYRKTAPLFSH